MRKFFVFGALSVLSTISIAQVDKAQSHRDDLFVEKNNNMLVVSPRVMDIISDWNNQSINQMTFVDYLLKKNQQAPIVDNYLLYLKSHSSHYIDLYEYTQQHSPVLIQQWHNDSVNNDYLPLLNNENGLATYLLSHNHPIFYEWQRKVNQGELNFDGYAQKHASVEYWQWQQELFNLPNRKPLTEWAKSYNTKERSALAQFMCLYDGHSKQECLTLFANNEKEFIERPTPIDNVRRPIEIDLPRLPVLPAPPPPPPPGCNCQYVVSNALTPNTYSQHSGQYEDTDDRKSHWWTEEFMAAHYAESYIYGKGENMTLTKGTLAKDNQTQTRITMLCLDAQKNQCSGCDADLDIFAQYASKVQVATDTWSLWGGKSEATAKDEVTLKYDGNGGSLTLINKLVALSQTSEKKFDFGSLISFTQDLVSIGALVYTGSTDATQYANLANDGYKNFKAIVERTGTQGINSEEMHAKYDSIGNASDPSIVIRANREYSVSMNTRGEVIYEGTGRNKSENSYYASGSALALSVNEHKCTADVNVKPKALACWSYGETYQSPLHGTTTLKSNVEQFLKHALELPYQSNFTINSNTGCY